MSKKGHIIVMLLLLVLKGNAVTVETTANLNVYYPEYSRIDLVCGQMPKAAQKDGIMGTVLMIHSCSMIPHSNIRCSL